MSREIHIVDDDENVRDSLTVLVRTLGYSTVAHETGDLFLESAPDLDTLCVLLDIRMPGRDGMEVLQAIRFQSKLAHIIIMTGHGDIPLAVKAIQDGANDFIEKPFEVSLVKSLLERYGRLKPSNSPLEKLTPRETEIAVRLSNGLSNKEIGLQLKISPRTVESHRARLMLKLGISSPAELVRLMLGA